MPPTDAVTTTSTTASVTTARMSASMTSGTASLRPYMKKEFEQPPALAGLLVTAELDSAIARCKAKVEHIVTSCRRKNLRFRDLSFDIEEDRERCLHGLNPPAADSKFTPADVLRVGQIFERPQFVIDGATSGDIVQGDIGNCWFLSAVATVSTVPGLVEKFCVARDEQVGVYGFIFWRDRGWVDVIIDDLLFTSVPKYEELTSKEKRLFHEEKDLFLRSARRGSKSLYFAKSGTENETWVPLLEKAYAKLHNDYASIQGGLAAEAVEDLTGAVSSILHSGDVLDTERFWNEELMRANKDRVFGCYIQRLSSQEGPSLINGLMTGHAYSIIKCVEYRGKRWIRVRNPWGRSEWTGRWADGSREWTGEWLQPEVLEALGHKFGDDGEFLMEYEDFMRTWSMIERSRLFDDTWRMSSLWLNVTAQSLPTSWSFGDVSFTFTIPARTPCVIVLAQIDSRYFKEISGYSQWSLEFALFARGGSEPLAESTHSIFWARSVNLEIELDAGEYVVHVRMDRRMHRQKDYFKTGIPNWDPRKLGRVWSEAALSHSIASNFNGSFYQDLLPMPLEKFAGQDLTKVELDAHAAAKKKRDDVLRASRSGGPAATTTTVVESTSYISTLSVSTEVPGTPVGRAGFSVSGLKGPQPVGDITQGDSEEQVQLLAPSVFGSASSPQNGVREDETPDEVVTLTIDGTEEDDGWQDEDQLEEQADTEYDTAPDTGTQDADNDGDAEGESAPDTDVPGESAPRQGGLPVHENYLCDGCGVSPIVGPMYVCMHASCTDYTLCGGCMDAGVHSRDHPFMRVDQPNDMQKMQRTSQPGDEDDVVLGLRVYSHRDAPASIQGQLRHGRLLQWTKN